MELISLTEEVVIVDIYSHSKNVYLITCQIYLINSAGKETSCGKIDARTHMDSKPSFRFPLNIRKKNLLDDKLEYLPNDSLTLRCECTVSTGIEFQRIEETFYDLHLIPFFKRTLHDSTVAPTPAKLKGVVDDLRSLYKDQIAGDVQLKAASKTFSAHKSVLCARSPVFRSMLTTNMKEKIMERIQIDDLDDDTIDQFLLFLYTDDLEDLQWESAMKLYYAADKYQVQLLKYLCSSFLVARLDISNVTDLLCLADRHQDSSLKTDVENFISTNSKKLFCTDEWERFMETNPKLAMKTMHFYLKSSSG
ncbi:uncharacterized protein LOC129975435 [Argiope bruennichi]|uniref:uncharacterized protein LOC129975435 n=1 Tax=Argiope bruennichi TaxID=94029 RepID=UPI002494FA7C|nr:uncharacterized protein LOC129975435 [Argiope bruennichi]